MTTNPRPEAIAQAFYCRGCGIMYARKLRGNNCLICGGEFVAGEFALAAQGSRGEDYDTHHFKNFHRLLCERFDYCHDEVDWRRDQLSLIEHIASRLTRRGAVDDAMVERARIAYHKARGSYEGESEIDPEDIRAALVAALEGKL